MTSVYSNRPRHHALEAVDRNYRDMTSAHEGSNALFIFQNVSNKHCWPPKSCKHRQNA